MFTLDRNTNVAAVEPDHDAELAARRAAAEALASVLSEPHPELHVSMRMRRNAEVEVPSPASRTDRETPRR